MIICHGAILHYNMSFKTIAGRSDGVFWWFLALSEDQIVFLSNSPKLSSGFKLTFDIPYQWKVYNMTYLWLTELIYLHVYVEHKYVSQDYTMKSIVFLFYSFIIGAIMSATTVWKECWGHPIHSRPQNTLTFFTLTFWHHYILTWNDMLTDWKKCITHRRTYCVGIFSLKI